MKKLFTLLALAGFSAATANPLPIGLATGKEALPQVASFKIESFYNNVVTNSVEKDNSTQAVTYKTVVPFVMFPAMTFYNEGTQMVYDAGADVISIYNNTYKVSGQNIVGSVNTVLTSTNNGLSWITNQLYDKAGPYAVWGSYSSINPNKSKNYSDWNSLTVAKNFVLNESKGLFEDKGRLFIIKNGTNIETAPFEGPTENNTAKFPYPESNQMVTFTKGGKNYVVGIGQSINYTDDDIPETEDRTRYSLFTFNFEDGDFVANTFPSSLASSNFGSFNPQDNSSGYNSTPNIDVDEEGTLYYGVCNLLLEDNTLRSTIVTKSTDLGKTWSDVKNINIPLSQLKEYAASKFADTPTDVTTAGILSHYEQAGFCVYGKNKFSFLIKLQSTNTTKEIAYIEIVECIYDNGVWSVKTVGELSTSVPVLLGQVAQAQQFSGRTKLYANTLGHEIQLSKTADGKFLVAKWIDIDTNQFTTGNFTFVSGRDAASEALITVDKLSTTDIYMSYRAIDGGNWSQPANVSKDLTFQKATKIPSIVPSISKVPTIFLDYSSTTLAAADSAIAKGPTWMRGMFIDGYNHPQKLQYYTFDATGASSVKDENPTTTGQFQLNPVFPNPATGVSEITFSMNKPGMAKLALINQVGQVVKVIYEGQLSEGLKAVTVNTDELAAGVYYYTLTVGDNSATKVLNVVK